MSLPVLAVPTPVRRAIVAQARRERPNECCGFLLGRGARVLYAVATSNVENSPIRYRIDDRAHLDLRRLLRHASPPLSIVGVYHSHPAGDARASPTDIADAMYQEWVYLIVGLGGRRPALRAYRIRGGRANEVPIRWTPAGTLTRRR